MGQPLTRQRSDHYDKLIYGRCAEYSKEEGYEAYLAGLECVLCPGQVSDFQPSVPFPPPGAYLTNFGLC